MTEDDVYSKNVCSRPGYITFSSGRSFKNEYSVKKDADDEYTTTLLNIKEQSHIMDPCLALSWARDAGCLTELLESEETAYLAEYDTLEKQIARQIEINDKDEFSSFIDQNYYKLKAFPAYEVLGRLCKDCATACVDAFLDSQLRIYVDLNEFYHAMNPARLPLEHAARGLSYSLTHLLLCRGAFPDDKGLKEALCAFRLLVPSPDLENTPILQFIMTELAPQTELYMDEENFVNAFNVIRILRLQVHTEFSQQIVPPKHPSPQQLAIKLDKLHQRHIRENGLCSSCGGGEESILHALFLCSNVKSMWDMSPFAGLLVDAPSSSFMDRLLWVLSKVSKDEFMLFVSLVWAAWAYRNSVVFGEPWNNRDIGVLGFVKLIGDNSKYIGAMTSSVRRVAVDFRSGWSPPDAGMTTMVSVKMVEALAARMGVCLARDLGVQQTDDEEEEEYKAETLLYLKEHGHHNVPCLALEQIEINDKDEFTSFIALNYYKLKAFPASQVLKRLCKDCATACVAAFLDSQLRIYVNLNERYEAMTIGCPLELAARGLSYIFLINGSKCFTMLDVGSGAQQSYINLMELFESPKLEEHLNMIKLLASYVEQLKICSLCLHYIEMGYIVELGALLFVCWDRLLVPSPDLENTPIVQFLMTELAPPSELDMDEATQKNFVNAFNVIGILRHQKMLKHEASHDITYAGPWGVSNDILLLKLTSESQVLSKKIFSKKQMLSRSTSQTYVVVKKGFKFSLQKVPPKGPLYPAQLAIELDKSVANSISKTLARVHAPLLRIVKRIIK
uniref:Uncharacterized protein n=1 Tax=Chenopodium quinoa TaxID=63459 RepID=A0A803LHY5_CHEQI